MSGCCLLARWWVLALWGQACVFAAWGGRSCGLRSEWAECSGPPGGDTQVLHRFSHGRNVSVTCFLPVIVPRYLLCLKKLSEMRHSLCLIELKSFLRGAVIVKW